MLHATQWDTIRLQPPKLQWLQTTLHPPWLQTTEHPTLQACEQPWLHGPQKLGTLHAARLHAWQMLWAVQILHAAKLHCKQLCVIAATQGSETASGQSAAPPPPCCGRTEIISSFTLNAIGGPAFPLHEGWAAAGRGAEREPPGARRPQPEHGKV
jgi:hypothetical protein